MTRTKKTTTFAALATAVVAITVIAITQQGADTTQIMTSPSVQIVEASADGAGTLAEQRAAAIKSGEVPDGYLISKAGTSWNDHMTDEEIERYERGVVTSLASRLDIPSNDWGASHTLRNHNFHTLMEKPDTRFDEVVALMLHRTVLDGTYEAADSEPVRKYQEHVLDTYKDVLPGTAQDIEERITQLTGEMAPLAPAMFDDRMERAAAGLPTSEQFGDDPEYWWAVIDLHHCEYNAANGHPDNDDCAGERDYLENERWLEKEDLTLEDIIPPPGQEWPPESWLNSVIQAAYAWSYVPMDYEVKYSLGGCNGESCPAETIASGRTTYVSDTWHPPMNPNSGCGHLRGTDVHTRMTVDRTVGTAYSVAILDVTADGDRPTDFDAGYKNRVTALTEHDDISPNPRAEWCYSATYTGYSLN